MAHDLEHNKCRSRVCILCYRKGTRSLSLTDVGAIQEFVIEGYSVDNYLFPSAICNGCYLILSKKRNGQNVKFPEVDTYDPGVSMVLRSSAICTCKICSVAKADKQDAVKMKKPRGRPTQHTDSTPTTSHKVCSNCFAKIYPGCNHSANMCASRREKVNNVEKLLNSDVVTKERIASRIIDTASDSSLATLGNQRKKIYTTPPSSSSSIQKQLNVGDLSMIQQDLNLSTRQTYTLATDLRKCTGSRKIVQSNYKEELYSSHHQLDSFFEG